MLPSHSAPTEVSSDRLPDFRNPGVIARILIVVHLGVFAFAALLASHPRQYAELLSSLATSCEPVVMAAVLSCYALSPSLARMRYVAGVLIIAAVVALLCACVSAVVQADAPELSWYSMARSVLLGVIAVLCLAEYLRLRTRALSPAYAEARLQSLQARIRPHFLFNSLNAVLSLIRSDPQRAERLMEDLADLFRTLMADNARLVPLRRELDLVRDYLRIETLRLGDRLKVELAVDTELDRCLVPPLFLQPLVENAVYHGIEPRRDPGEIALRVRRHGRRVQVLVSNPVPLRDVVRPGNGMALSNIRERLALHFDSDASLKAGAAGDRYEVCVDLPLREAGS